MNKTVSLEELSYCPDSCALFERLHGLPGRAFLDSSFPHNRSGRYDILCADPGASPAQPEQNAGSVAWNVYFDDLCRFHQQHFGGVQPASQDIPFLRWFAGCNRV